MQDRRNRPTPESTVVYLELSGAERHDPRTRDDVVVGAVRRLREELRRTDAVGRYEDGILTLLSGVRADLGERVAKRMLCALDREPVHVSRGEIRVGATASIAEVPAGGALDDAVERARALKRSP